MRSATCAARWRSAVIIELLKSVIGPLFRIDATPPRVPPGASGIEVFRASPRYLSYRYSLLALKSAAASLGIAIGAVSVGVGAAESGLDGWMIGGLVFVAGVGR